MASNPAGKFKLELTPLPTRVSRLAVDRLNNLRDYDGMTIQEHVRRAVDEYLDRIEAKYTRKLPPRAEHPLASPAFADPSLPAGQAPAVGASAHTPKPSAKNPYAAVKAG